MTRLTIITADAMVEATHDDLPTVLSETTHYVRQMLPLSLQRESVIRRVEDALRVGPPILVADDDLGITICVI